MRNRIYLSPPNIHKDEKESVSLALESGWIAPIGPALDAFESSLRTHYEGKSVLLTNSGTSALHLALILADIQPGDLVLTNSMTFAACANVILYQQAVPVFVDCEQTTLSVDPDLLEQHLAASTQIPKALILTHLYGLAAQVDRIKRICSKYGIILVEDAAEAVGTTYQGRPAGTFGDLAAISFNGNKIVTASSGGALIGTKLHYDQGLHLATQANRGTGEYEHDRVGFNYRMSNILASLGDAQLSRLSSFLQKKKAIFSRYRKELSDFLHFFSEPEDSTSNYWLSTAVIRSAHDPHELVKWMENHNIECRRFWKPLHMHQAYRDYAFIGSGSCEELFNRGICLPSGTGLEESDQSYVIESIRNFFTTRQ